MFYISCILFASVTHKAPVNRLPAQDSDIFLGLWSILTFSTQPYIILMVVALNFTLTKKYEFSILDCNVSAKSFVPLQQLHRRGFLGSFSDNDIWGVSGWHFVLSHWLLFQKPSKGMWYADPNAFDTVLKWWPAEPFKSNWILHPSHRTIGA